MRRYLGDKNTISMKIIAICSTGSAEGSKKTVYKSGLWN